MKTLNSLLVLTMSLCSFGQGNGVDLRLFENDLETIINATIQFPKCETRECPGFGGSIYIDSDRKKYYTGRRFGGNSILKRDYTNISEQYFVINSYSNIQANSWLDKDLLLELSNPELGTIYIETRLHNLPDVKIVSDIKIPPPEVIYCSEFTQVVDKFENTITTSPKGKGGIWFKKVEYVDKSIIHLECSSWGNTLKIGDRGAAFIFENGDKYDFPDAVVVVEAVSEEWNKLCAAFDIPTYKWRYKVFIQMSDEEINLFAKSHITDSKLATHIYEYDPLYSEEYRQQLICLINDNYRIID
jgi:hypothetical protein